MTDHFRFPRLSRREFLASTAAVGGAALLGSPWSRAHASTPALTVNSRVIEVKGKAARVFGVIGANGRPGLMARAGDRFTGSLHNASTDPLQIHWHGQVRAPADQDRSHPGGGLLAPGASESHDFELTPGTHWMHSHTLTEQQLLAAPMVTREADAGDTQDVVILLHDFTFRSPQEILTELGGVDAAAGHGAHQPRPTQAMPGHGGHMMAMTHANDVRYDAFLANDRALDDPEIVRVDKGGRVRLRIINGGTATAFFISTPGLTSECVAVDGSPCQPVKAQSYPLAQGQRIDLLISIPATGGAFPVLAQVEAARSVTGVVLATAGASVTKLAETADQAQSLVDLGFETQLRAARPLPAKRADKTFMVMLGELAGYRWTINGRVHGEHAPFEVRQGERIEMTFMNPTSMMHPMHLHGHHFQVVGIGGRTIPGAIRDTLIVPAHMPVTIGFDAGLKGAWFLHCHHLYHMATGMMTELRVT
ncbi:MAG: multicopper oxidase domain-containing protein [Hyphomicrobiaceae bacterium]